MVIGIDFGLTPAATIGMGEAGIITTAELCLALEALLRFVKEMQEIKSDGQG